jgi:hypothetical protein
MAQPTDRAGVLARAALIIAHQGLHHGDFIPDPFDRRLSTPHYLRPMSVVGAINCAVSGDPRIPSNLSWAAIRLVGRMVLVDGEPAAADTIEALERHVDNWSDDHSAAQVVEGLRLLAGRSATQAAAAGQQVAA